MKILSFDPGSLRSSSDLDDSRLAYHARTAKIDDLPRLEHGIVVVGLADDTGVRNVGGRLGAKDGPAVTRRNLYKFTLGAPPVPLYDLGDVAPSTSIEATHETARTVIEAIFRAGHFPIVIGGGHDLAFPHSLAWLTSGKRTATVFWNLDAHLDVRPASPVITSGSPWYLLREHEVFARGKNSIAEFGLQRHCNAHALVDYAEEKRFKLHWLNEIRRAKKPADETFARLLRRSTPGKTDALVSLDIDSVRWSEAPGCSAPQVEGFTAAEVIRMSYLAGAHARVKSFGIFELSPTQDPDGRTSALVAHCIRSCIGGYASRRKRK